MKLPPHLAEQLSQVPTTSDGYCTYAPCRVTLKSGETLDRVYLVERSVLQMWGHKEPTVPVDEIDRIDDSPLRLPAKWANVLYKAGESGMGYTLFVATLKDGSTLPFVVGNAVDFPSWPPGIDPTQVVDVQPHAGRDIFRDRAPTTYERSAPYEWCVYDA